MRRAFVAVLLATAVSACGGSDPIGDCKTLTELACNRTFECFPTGSQQLYGTVADCIAFYRTWYVPANATLVIAGDVDLDELHALIDRYFGSFPVSQRPARRVPASPVRTASHEQTVVDPLAALVRIHRAWHGPVCGLVPRRKANRLCEQP